MIKQGEIKVGLVTTPNTDVAINIARKIVESKLAACVNIIPKVTSIYFWKGEVVEDTESLMIIKTSKNSVNELISLIRNMHPYEVPEIIFLDVTEGNEEYLRWVLDESAGTPKVG